MKLFDLLQLYSGSLICIQFEEQSSSSECIYCGTPDNLSAKTLFQYGNTPIKRFFIESYGAFYGHDGITISINKEKSL